MLKKFLSVGLALVMCASLFCVLVSATEPNPDDSIMPRAVIYPSSTVSLSGDSTYCSRKFTATSGNGNYIRFWFLNQKDTSVKVYLYRTDLSTERVVKSMTVSGNDQNMDVYHTATAGSGTYYIKIESPTGRSIAGNLSVAQYVTNPS